MGITGKPIGKGGKLHYTQEEVEQITKGPTGIACSEAVEIMIKNGWPFTKVTLSQMLNNGNVKGTKIAIDKSSGISKWRYDEAQIRSLKYVKKTEKTIKEKSQKMGISRQTYYNLKKNNPEILGDMLMEAGINV